MIEPGGYSLSRPHAGHGRLGHQQQPTAGAGQAQVPLHGPALFGRGEHQDDQPPGLGLPAARHRGLLPQEAPGGPPERVAGRVVDRGLDADRTLGPVIDPVALGQQSHGRCLDRGAEAGKRELLERLAARQQRRYGLAVLDMQVMPVAVE
jgi:hypothetical protein